ncbi:MAG: YfcE family phosphodiesterase [Firmicutes bacterium]|nr:YfcE family phosphodiesterase [Bacillota bacterium]
MKVVIVSDSHGNIGVLKRIVKQEEPFDLLFHLGDGIEDSLRLRRLVGFNVDGVEGNNDLKGQFPTSLVLKIGKRRCLFTHGHLFDVGHDLSILVGQARIEKAALVFFGHTHRFHDSILKGVRLLNPGSVCNYFTKEAGYLVLVMEKNNLSIERRLIKDINFGKNT